MSNVHQSWRSSDHLFTNSRNRTTLKSIVSLDNRIELRLEVIYKGFSTPYPPLSANDLLNGHHDGDVGHASGAQVSRAVRR